MAKLRLSIILSFIIIPPVMYVVSLHILEQYAGHRFQTRLEKIYLGDVSQLLKGSRPLKAAIGQNVRGYVRQSRWTAMGCRVVITVMTRANTLLYPIYESEHPSSADANMQTVEIAVENYRLISEIPEVRSALKLPYNSAMAFAILGLYVILPLIGISFYYRQWQKVQTSKEKNQAKEHHRLTERSNRYRSQMTDLERESKRLADEVVQMKAKLEKEKTKADANVEEMLEDIIALEEEISQNTLLQEKQQKHIETLQKRLESVEREHKRQIGPKAGTSEMTLKRLNALYKNIDIHDRAVAGYLGLAEDLKIKCEETIYQLNDDPSKVKVKRKVFGKKNRATVLEVVFGYKGRLYYRFQASRRAEVLVIGTKNSQQADLVYLDRL